MLNLVYDNVKNASVYGPENFPKIEDVLFRYLPAVYDKEGRVMRPSMVEVIRNWPGHRLDGELLGDIKVQ